MESRLTIGLFGFGVVGEGIYQVLQMTPTLNASVKKICIKHPEKPRNAPGELFTVSSYEILDDPEINLVVELIDDVRQAFDLVAIAMSKGKAVVSANKKMIAEHLDELLKLQLTFQVPFLYEGAVCGSIPILRNLEEYYDNDLLDGICGIVNGSTNYILTQMRQAGSDYSKALREAQALGFAESDPSLDVGGRDAVNKLTILLLHGYGILSKPEEHLYLGITRLHPFDGMIAREKSLEIKLCAQAKKLAENRIACFVLPQFVTEESQLYRVDREYNGIVLQSSFADKQFLYGKGAGRYPTASAVLSDISALRYDYRYEYRKKNFGTPARLAGDFYLRIYVSFPSWSMVVRDDFEWIDEFRCHDQRQYLVGVIHYNRLRSCDWMKNAAVSVIACPDSIVEDISYREAREKSFELAGSQYVDYTQEVLNSLKTLL